MHGRGLPPGTRDRHERIIDPRPAVATPTPSDRVLAGEPPHMANNCSDAMPYDASA